MSPEDTGQLDSDVQGQGLPETKPESSEATKPWWETVKSEEIDAYLDNDPQGLLKSRVDRRVQSEVERGLQSYKSGKPSRLNSKVAELIREVQETEKGKFQAESAAAQERQFQEQWRSMESEERASMAVQFIDATLRDQRQRQWMEEQMRPQVNQQAIGLAAQSLRGALAEGISNDEWQAAVEKTGAVLSERGIDPNSPAGMHAGTQILIDAVKEYHVEKAVEERNADMKKDLEIFKQSLRAELLGENLRKAESPDQGRSVGGEAPGADELLVQNDNASITDRRAAFKRLYGFEVPWP